MSFGALLPVIFDYSLPDFLLSTYCLISRTTSLAFSLPVLLPFGPPVYDLPAPGPSYLPPPVVLCNKHLLRRALETSSLSPLVFITDVGASFEPACYSRKTILQQQEM
jgi:hypothetical protein